MSHQTALLRAKTDRMNAFGEDWLSQQFYQKFKIASVFVDQQGARKRKQNNFNIKTSTSLNLKSMTLKEGRHILSVSNSSRGQHCPSGSRNQNKKGKPILMAPPEKSCKKEAGQQMGKGVGMGKNQQNNRAPDFVWLTLDTLCLPSRRTNAFSKYKQYV